MPDCLPRIVTDTRGRAFSFSSSILPDTVADFFCAGEDWKINRERMKRAGATILNEKLFKMTEIKQICLLRKTQLPGFYVYLVV